jgi:hypothetical protein
MVSPQENIMNQKILANLNLSQSVEEFQVSIKELFKLDNVTEWTGRTIKEREEKIREAALILAGQCVAILVDNLSKSKEAKETALNLTKGWWRKKTKKNGYKTWQILTVGNVIVNLKLPYVVEIKKRKDYKIKPKGQGFCPFLRWLGMEESVTPYVWSTLAKYGAISTSFEIARQTLKDWGVKINLKRLQRLTYKFGGEGLSIRRGKILSLERNSLPTSSVLKDKRVIISVDGGRTRVRIEKNEKPNPKTKRKKYTGEWFHKRLSKGLFDYKKISQLNLPIGSGAVESLIRQARDLRLKGNGKFWLQHNAEIILHARCQWLSGNWNNFSDSILTSRIYPAFG